MTNARAIEILRAIHAREIASEKFYTGLSERKWKRVLREVQNERAALEHAIGALETVERLYQKASPREYFS